MPRPRREPMDIITSIVEKRQPLTLRDVRYFARCYVALADMPKEDMYDLIRANFNVDEYNRVTMPRREMIKWREK
ncbi:hypothetical protein KGB42_gp02 [Salmonella phage Seszw_1]|uniref:Uncharacterized protein n=1 Tax=Salmonella phage Seszw_1 TaxID=2479482 RepID=A0A411BEZ7_9CAUD|nr:hypothetical protein KGB42_gp02 [Salmonella phage Seszw_1]QAY00213.1 hypothetical protein Seszw_2 [Salmonella phage Seszw_1]UJD19883.1 hypothetical protein seszw2t3_2 [Salmonella phage seszw]UJD20486.1 hypothetical protein seszw2t1_2 [Salmonella phage seszw]UJD20553.1 hypothetical protein seszw2t2_2 [Salmonella phage seszw]